MTVVPLFCAKWMGRHEADEELHGDKISTLGRIVEKFNLYFEKMLGKYDRTLLSLTARPVATVVGLLGVFLLASPFIRCWAFPSSREPIPASS